MTSPAKWQPSHTEPAPGATTTPAGPPSAIDRARALYTAALDSKPGKGEWPSDALVEAVAAIPDLLAELEELRREPDEALVEVAARALWDAHRDHSEDPPWGDPELHARFEQHYRNTARAVFRAVGPTLLARGWDEGHYTGGEVCDCPNPHDRGAS